MSLSGKRTYGVVLSTVASESLLGKFLSCSFCSSTFYNNVFSTFILFLTVIHKMHTQPTFFLILDLNFCRGIISAHTIPSFSGFWCMSNFCCFLLPSHASFIPFQLCSSPFFISENILLKHQSISCHWPCLAVVHFYISRVLSHRLKITKSPLLPVSSRGVYFRNPQ